MQSIGSTASTVSTATTPSTSTSSASPPARRTRPVAFSSDEEGSEEESEGGEIKQGNLDEDSESDVEILSKPPQPKVQSQQTYVQITFLSFDQFIYSNYSLVRLLNYQPNYPTPIYHCGRNCITARTGHKKAPRAGKLLSSLLLSPRICSRLLYIYPLTRTCLTLVSQ